MTQPTAAEPTASAPGARAVVGLDVGATSINATVADGAGRFLVHRLVETPSLVGEGPGAAVEALAAALDAVLGLTGVDRGLVVAVGLDTPGPASADGVISSKGSTNFSQPAWRGFDFRGAVQTRLGLPVVYLNDGNAAAYYAHRVHFGGSAGDRSSVSAIVGTGLGGGIVEAGRVVGGAAGMAGELGHIQIPLGGLLDEGQPIPVCNCGNEGDVESIASLTGIQNNLLPYWLRRVPDHPLASAVSVADAAKLVRSLGEQGDPVARRIFEQQAIALGRLFTIASNVTDPHAYFVGGGVVEAEAGFREWFLTTVRQHTALRAEQQLVAQFALVPELDMAGARGSALAALAAVATG